MRLIHRSILLRWNPKVGHSERCHSYKVFGVTVWTVAYASCCAATDGLFPRAIPRFGVNLD